MLEQGIAEARPYIRFLRGSTRRKGSVLFVCLECCFLSRRLPFREP